MMRGGGYIKWTFNWASGILGNYMEIYGRIWNLNEFNMDLLQSYLVGCELLITCWV
jgi:hypothetical protein